MTGRWEIKYQPQTHKHNVDSGPITGGYKEDTLLPLGKNVPYWRMDL
jgi:hypothetical protein